MKKRIFCLILALVMVLSLAACAGSGNDNTENTKDTTTNTEGSEATTPVSGGEAELALITDANSIDDRGFNQFSWEGLKQYAEENGKTYTYYTPIDQSTQSYLSAIEGAVNNGAKLIVTPGFLFGEAIYKAQTMYPDVHFVLVDATPTLDDDTVIADNTCSIFFAEEQSGFLAGYAAVKEGYRKLGFFGALAVPAVVRYGYGFVDGAEYAAKELGLEAGSIEMKYTYTGAFGNSPDFQAKAAAWYQSGTECIFGCGGPDNVFAACEATGGDCVSIGVDTDMSQITETCLTSAMKMLVPAVYGAIKAYYNDTFPGGTSETLTINDDAVGLPMETSRFKNFTQADYDAIVEVLKADKDGVTSSIRRDVDAEGNTVTIEDVAATLQYVTVQVVE